MFYCVSRYKQENEYAGFVVYNSLTKNVCKMKTAQIYSLIKLGIPFANFYIKKGKVHQKHWSSKMLKDLFDDSGHVLTILYDMNQYKTAEIVNTYGYVDYRSILELYTLIERNRIANVELKREGKAENYIFSDVEHESERQNAELEIEVKHKYDAFIAKTCMLGLDERFTYLVIGNDVIYEQYIGLSNTLIIPGFVTVVAEGCLMCKRGKTYWARDDISNINSITISSGVQFIEDMAFISVNINKAIIPSSVKYLGANAFKDSSHLYSEDEYNMNNLCIENPQYTIIGYPID